uniref:Uncharacterized protein n=1 Tax=Setaria viridis TaxID=4556 RepID=A0A4U6SZ73_SETVI|nr:hypothetical protein SEVIR_9G290600v2 [Setaria viridis]
MSTRGLKIIQDKYYMATGLKHDLSQFRNRRDQLKRKRPDLRKLQHGAPEYLDQLEEMFHETAVDGSTAYIPEVEEEEEEDGEDDDIGDPSVGGEDCDAQHASFYDSPKSSNTRKRSNASTKSTATSPPKESRSPMINAVTNYFNRQSEKDDVTYSIFRSVGASIVKFTEDKRQKMTTNVVADEVRRCQQLALDCGASKDSAEMFAC